MRRFILFLLALVMMLSLAVSASSAPLKTMTAPQLADLLRDSKGKIVLINFFASWCPPCRAEIPDLMTLRRDYSEEELVMIGISVDEDLDKIKAFIERTGFNYPVYLTDFRLPGMYSVSSIPHNVIYLPSGKLIYSEGGIIARDELSAMFNSILKEKQDFRYAGPHVGHPVHPLPASDLIRRRSSASALPVRAVRPSA